MINLIDRANESSDCMPNIYDGLKCYPYTIEVKKGGNANVKGSASFLGGFFKKFTN